MKRSLLLGAFVLLPAAILAACGGGGGGGDSASGGGGAGQQAAAATSASGSSGEIRIRLQEQNGSGESGSATLTPAAGGKTRVVLVLKSPTTDSQPAHIHRGTCRNLDPDPLFGLINVVHGRSETVVDVPLSTLTSGGYAINVHHSNSNLGRYVACGDLPGGAGAAASSRSGGY